MNDYLSSLGLDLADLDLTHNDLRDDRDASELGTPHAAHTARPEADDAVLDEEGREHNLDSFDALEALSDAAHAAAVSLITERPARP